VREALVVSAVLRLYEGRQRDLLQAFVDDVLQLVELTPNRDMMVRGVHSKGCPLAGSVLLQMCCQQSLHLCIAQGLLLCMCLMWHIL
jgi:hypothetical protein